MSHLIVKFSVDRSGNNVRIDYEEFQDRTPGAPRRLLCLLRRDDALQLAAALESNDKFETTIPGETGECLVLSITPTPIGDRQVQISLQVPVPAAPARLLASAIRKEAQAM